jgi:hypothetical protein
VDRAAKVFSWQHFGRRIRYPVEVAMIVCTVTGLA